MNPRMFNWRKYSIEHGLDDERFYMLRSFCLHYREWEERYKELEGIVSSGIKDRYVGKCFKNRNTWWSVVECAVMERNDIENRLSVVPRLAEKVDPNIAQYLIRGVTQDKPYSVLKKEMNIPFSENYYEACWRMFFCLLNDVYLEQHEKVTSYSE